jgi:outer membrane protein TolC
MRYNLTFLLLFQSLFLLGQETPQEVLGFTEFLAYVKQYHPVARQANLHLEMGEAELLRARGAFDPKLEVDYAQKEFKGTEYYDILNSTFKIPTWYGIELKAGFDQAEGVFLNPERTVPPEGLFSAGVSLSAAQGLVIDKRRAVLRSARALMDQAAAERDLMVSEVLYEAAVAYLQWAQLHRENQVYNDFVANARQRFTGISQSAAAGEIPAIDTVEAGITLQDRLLQLEQTRVKLLKQRLEVSNFLWLENNVPVELQPEIVPEDILDDSEYFGEEIEDWLEGYDLSEHPKLQALQAKLQALRIERRLKMNNLLPKVDLEYNFLTPEPELVDNFDTSNYKAGVKFSFPLFLRKERGELKLAKFKLQDASLELELSRRRIDNKVEALLQELESYVDQINISEEMVENYQKLLQAEERKFSFGESSLFLINTKYLVAKAELFRSLGVIPDNLE